MGPIPFAFSVHHFINSVGADAGFASIIGLAILVLLYFAQARETSSLREQAYELGQRIAQLEARIVQLTRQQQASPPPQAAAAPRHPQPARSRVRLPGPVRARSPRAEPRRLPVQRAFRFLPSSALLPARLRALRRRR